ncbi:hypothetical protein ACFPT0_13720 [Acinetobacter portensis]|uniref:hypothetical protein n=1 Tax=Acinetobacter portensis TaxID=1839785 RepID=UPI00148F1828|nr:hypothetical protein [Acinetobacter portensis]
MSKDINPELEKAKADQLEALVKIVNSSAYQNPSVKRSTDDAIRRISESIR